MICKKLFFLYIIYYLTIYFATILGLESMPPKIVIIFLTLALMCYNFNLVTSKKHYISPIHYDQSKPWPCKENQKCSTLSQFADEYPTQHLDSSTDLVLLPGQHHLKSELNVFDIRNFEMMAYSSNASMICDKSLRLTWTGVHQVLIFGIKIKGCGLNASSVKHFKIVNSTFIESVVSHTVLFIIQSNITITNSTFIFNMTGNTRDPKASSQESHFSSQLGISNKQSTWTKAFGAVIAATDKSNVVIINSRVEGNSALLGGVIFTELGSKISIANATITGSGFRNVTGGTIVYAETGSVLTMNNIIISDNKAVNGKGVVFLHNSSLVAYRAVCRNNLAQEGGVIYALNSKLTITESTFTGNSAVDHGGVLHLKHSIANINDCIFKYNTALNGGAIYSGPYSTVEVYRSSFTFNQAINDAGAILGDQGMLTILHVTFSDNRAKWAGAVAAYENTEIVIKECKLNYNKAKWGGALALHKGAISVKSSIIDYQQVTQQGGSIYVNAGILTVETSSIDYNEAEQDGGAIIGVDATLVINGTNFTNNAATYYGSVLHWSRGTIRCYGDFLVESNMAEKGLMYLYDSSATFIGNISFMDNHALLYTINSHVTFAGSTTFPMLEINSGEMEKKKMTKNEGTSSR